MHTSTDRILTTHAGSIPRGEPLGQMLIDEEAGKPVDYSALQSNIGLRVSHVLEKQAEAGIDIINDGEQGRVGFQTYVTQRMSGFGGVSKRPYGKEFIEYPQFTKRMMERLGKISKVFDAPEAIADIKYRDTTLIYCRGPWCVLSSRPLLCCVTRVTERDGSKMASRNGKWQGSRSARRSYRDPGHLPAAKEAGGNERGRRQI